MNTKFCCCFLAMSLLAPVLVAQETQTAVSVRQGIPQDVHMAVYAKENPERAYQREHMAAVWNTFQEEKIAERFFAAVTRQVSEEDLDKARSVMDELLGALDPINCEALLDAEEFAYAQAMEQIFTHHLFLVNLTEADAAGFQQGFEQLFDLISAWSDNEVSKQTQEVDGASMVMLKLPHGVPFSPTLVRQGDIIIFSSSKALAEQSLKSLNDESAVSKFDDPRFADALTQLPEPEDAIVIFDGQVMFEKLHGITDFLRQQGAGRNTEIVRVSQVIDHVINEVAIIDFELTVEYTEGYQNRVAVFGKLVPDANEKLLYKAVTQGKPFEDWQSWIPADAEGYSLNTGFNLHVVYEHVMAFVREEFPEAHEGLDRFEAIQEKIGFHLDRDLLQAFSGEVVSVTVPVEAEDGSIANHSVTALRCHDADGIQKLMSRGMEALKELPPVQAQQLELVECEDLEGFQELSGAIFTMVNVRPVIGFHDGWMMISTDSAAVAKVIATRKGEAEAISKADSFQKFDLEVNGPVAAISYTDVGATVHQVADMIDKVGAMAPMFFGMMAANADPEDMKPVQEIVGLLPSIAKVVRKFDFLEHQLSVTRGGPQDGTYLRDSVWLIRPIEEKVAEVATE